MAKDVFENGLLFYCHMARDELLHFLDYHQKTEDAWAREDMGVQRTLNDLLKKHSEAEREEIVDTYAYELHLAQYKYPDIHRSALVIAAFVFLEDQLNGLCDTVTDTMETSLTFADFQGSGVERAKLFLSRVAEFNFGIVGSWSFVSNAIRLRNRIVHAGGLLPEDPNDRVNRFVRDTIGLQGQPGGRVTVRSEFIDHLIRQLIELFAELNDQVGNFISRHHAEEQRETNSRGASEATN